LYFGKYLIGGEIMAVWTVKSQSELGKSFVLAPERYDPRRILASSEEESTSVSLAQMAKLVRQTVTATTGGDESYLVLDTSHAREGVITSPKYTVKRPEIGSTKKVIDKNDVIISRLRPYLRQVALVDGELHGWSSGSTLICSTEFFVLRSIDERSIAFLVPYLLSPSVQMVLAASQEGGHHPRFDEATLLTLPIPSRILERRDLISQSVEKSIRLYRESEKLMASMIDEASCE
jgi:hypothetical protein